MKNYEFKKNETGDIDVIYYDENGNEELKEYYSKEDGTEKTTIREGYVLKTD